jgi:hypothetical protein
MVEEVRVRSQSHALGRKLNRLCGQRQARELFRIPEADSLMCQTRRATEGIEWISGREVELVVKKKN